jgi:hypothetical protein
MNLDREQEQINDAEDAKRLKENPFFNKMLVTLKAGYVEKLTKIKKGKHYEAELKDVHDSLQNLMRIEGFIEKTISDGRIVMDKRTKRSLNN